MRPGKPQGEVDGLRSTVDQKNGVQSVWRKSGQTARRNLRRLHNESGNWCSVVDHWWPAASRQAWMAMADNGDIVDHVQIGAAGRCRTYAPSSRALSAVDRHSSVSAAWQNERRGVEAACVLSTLAHPGPTPSNADGRGQSADQVSACAGRANNGGIKSGSRQIAVVGRRPTLLHPRSCRGCPPHPLRHQSRTGIPGRGYASPDCRSPA